MNRLLVLLRMNMKLLFRNKGFLFFLCVTPIVSAFILNVKTESGIYENKESRTSIIELDKSSDRAVYVGDTSAYIIKVYDASMTEMSNFILHKLALTGMFSVCRCDVRSMTEEEVEEQAKMDAFDDRVGTLLYLKSGFDEWALSGDYENAMQIYAVSEDERWDLFETELEDTLLQIHHVAEYMGTNSSEVIKVLKSIEDEMPGKQVVSLSGKEDIVLTNEQLNQKSLIGFAFAFITLGFMFCGVCVAHTVIEEQDNKVYTRVMLSKLSIQEYYFSKMIMALIISLMQTFILGICIFCIKDIDFGINKFVFLAIIFFLGLIFSSISLLMGVLIGDVMSANYAVFALWSNSALLSGLYFPLDSTSTVLKAISVLMPQRWFMKASEMLLVGDKGAYAVILYITVAYLVLSISVGSIGLKMKRSDS
ncbi:MAG TPA: ABC transporter permease [Lachnospiraceae bacterium]|nr:ABC transporter permease [Lachnospiraceae bacterium]